MASDPAAEQRLAAMADRIDELRAELAAEIERRDGAVIEYLDGGILTKERVKAAARLSTSGLNHVLERAG